MKWVKVIAGAAVVAMSLVLLVYGAHRPEITIQKVSVSGTHLSDASAIEEISKDALDGYYFFFIPKANAFVAPLGSIASAVKTAFPEVAAVEVRRTGFEALEIDVSERVALAEWCENGTSSCYLMDETGFIYSDTRAPHPMIRFSGGIQGEVLGSVYLMEDFPSLFSFIGEVERATKLSPVSVKVDENDDVHVDFSEGGTLMFVRKEDTNETLQNIASVFAARRLKNGERFDYADFRFGDKVFVRFIGD